LLPATREVELRNRGNRRGSFRISYEESLPMRIRPNHGDLDPGMAVRVQVN
jgi:hypothetical protein